jgi:cell division septation protein DedD
MSQKKKMFVQKNLQSEGSRSPLKVLIWAAGALVVMLIVTPLLLHQKNDKDGIRPPAERGKVVKNIPKGSGQPPGGAGQPSGMNDEYPRGPASVPGVLPDTGSVARTGDVSQPGPAGAKPTEGGEGVPGKPGAVEQPEPTRSVTLPAAGLQPQGGEPAPATGSVQQRSPGGVTPPASTSVPPTEPGQRMASAGPAAGEPKKPLPGTPGIGPDASRTKKPAPGAKGKYAVQVGSFKDKKNADELQKNLLKKGYQTDVKVSVHPTLGQLYVVTLKPVESLSKANTLMEQIKNEEKVKPILTESR